MKHIQTGMSFVSIAVITVFVQPPTQMFSMSIIGSNAPKETERITSKDSTRLGERWGISGGMGVCYINAQDIVDLVNSRAVNQRVPEFKAAVEFFGDLVIPISEGWGLACEYSYILGSYNFNYGFGQTEASFTVHLPTVIAQYSLADERLYDVRIGFGTGYHFGSYSETIAGGEKTYTGRGIGILVDLEAHTAFSEDFYGYLGGNLRWEFIGDLRDSAGKSPNVIVGSVPVTLHLFGLGARLGFSYFF